MRRDKSNYIIQSVAHALDVLEEYRGETDELGVTELSKKLKLHKNNVFRILATLQSRNYIEQNKSNDNYKLGIKCLELGQTFIHQRGLLKQAKAILRELAEMTGETSYLSFLRGNEVVYLDAVEGTSTVRVVSRVGLHMPLHATAAGKALVASESDEELAKRFRRDPQVHEKHQDHASRTPRRPGESPGAGIRNRFRGVRGRAPLPGLAHPRLHPQGDRRDQRVRPGPSDLRGADQRGDRERGRARRLFLVRPARVSGISDPDFPHPYLLTAGSLWRTFS